MLGPWRTAAIALGVVLLGFWLLFFASWPARQVGQFTIAASGGEPVKLTLWRASPIIPLPFTTASSWVRCGDRSWKLHGRGFGGHPGPLLLSPDGTEIVVCRGWEGGTFPVVVIDLRTGATRDAPPRFGARDYEAAGWSRQKWRTELEPLTDQQLMAQLRSGDRDRFFAARNELERRPFTDEHWRMYAEVALDPDLPEQLRQTLPHTLYHDNGELRYEDELSFIFARLNDPDRKVRLFAAWSLCQLSQYTPEREFDLVAIWQAGPDVIDAKVTQERDWWAANAEPRHRKSMTSDATEGG